MDKSEVFEIKRRMAEILTPKQMYFLDETLKTFTIEAKESEKTDYIKLFLSAKRVEGCSFKTEFYYQKVLRIFENKIQKPLLLITTEEIRDYLTEYQNKNGCSLMTIDNIRRILSSFYQWLENEDHIIKSPMKRIHKIKIPVTLKPVFTEEEIEILRNDSGNERNSAILNLLVSSGMRVGELVKLNRRDINLTDCSCTVFGKGKKERLVYFDVKTKIALIRYLNERHDKIPALFVTQRKYKKGKFRRLCINTVEKILNDYSCNFDYKLKINPHKFRRSLATRAIDKGMPIEQVQALLGHTKIDTTLLYAQVQQKNVMYSYRHFIG